LTASVAKIAPYATEQKVCIV